MSPAPQRRFRRRRRRRRRRCRGRLLGPCTEQVRRLACNCSMYRARSTERQERRERVGKAVQGMEQGRPHDDAGVMNRSVHSHRHPSFSNVNNRCADLLIFCRLFWLILFYLRPSPYPSAPKFIMAFFILFLISVYLHPCD